MSKSLESSGKDVIELKGNVPCDSRAIQRNRELT